MNIFKFIPALFLLAAPMANAGPSLGKTPWDILGIAEDASANQVNAAYERIVSAAQSHRKPKGQPRNALVISLAKTLMLDSERFDAYRQYQAMAHFFHPRDRVLWTEIAAATPERWSGHLKQKLVDGFGPFAPPGTLRLTDVFRGSAAEDDLVVKYSPEIKKLAREVRTYLEITESPSESKLKDLIQKLAENSLIWTAALKLNITHGDLVFAGPLTRSLFIAQIRYRFLRQMISHALRPLADSAQESSRGVLRSKLLLKFVDAVTAERELKIGALLYLFREDPASPLGNAEELTVASRKASEWRASLFLDSFLMIKSFRMDKDLNAFHDFFGHFDQQMTPSPLIAGRNRLSKAINSTLAAAQCAYYFVKVSTWDEHEPGRAPEPR